MTSCKNLTRKTLKVSKALEPEQIKPLELRLTGCHIFQCDSARRLWKDSNLSSVFASYAMVTIFVTKKTHSFLALIRPHAILHRPRALLFFTFPQTEMKSANNKRISKKQREGQLLMIVL